MKPEPLKGKVVYMPNGWIRVDNVKSACEFYLKFRNDPSVLFALHPQYYEDFEEKHGELSKHLIDRTIYNEWLFKLAFSAVLGGEA